MGDIVADGAEFKCPLCTGSLKIKVIATKMKGESKKLANKGNCLFPPPGGNCILIPSSPVPCTPAAVNTDPGQSPIKIQSLPALGQGCKFQCAKGGLITRSDSAQTKANHN